MDLHPPEPIVGSGLTWWRGSQLTIGWKGHVYLSGVEAGATSMAALADMLDKQELERVAPQLQGVFALFVHDERRGVWQGMSDNAGLFHVFYDDRHLATSFLDLSQARGASRAELSRASLVAYLAHGALLGEPTFLSTVRKLRGNEIAEIDDGGRVSIRTKQLDARGAGNVDLVLEHFRELSASLAGRRVSVDGTGGFDSRLLLCLLDHYGTQFEIATSGQPGTADTEIPQRIAKILDRPFHLSGHDLSRLEEDVPLVFRAGDGLTDVRRLHRDLQLAQERLQRGVELIVHGGGGEFFRDHYVIQDWPRYGSPQTNFERWYDLRIMPLRLQSAWLTTEAAADLAGLRTQTLARLEEHRAATNSESYCRAYYFLRAPEHFGQYYSNYINMGLLVAAPMLDHTVVRTAFAMPPWQQFFYRWHRRLITQIRPEVAALPTADGFSASSRPALMARDLGSYSTMQTRRIARKLSQRFLGKGKFYAAGAFVADSPGFIAKLRTIRYFPMAMERLKEVGVLAPDLASDQVGDIHVGRIITAGMYVESLSDHQNPNAT